MAIKDTQAFVADSSMSSALSSIWAGLSCHLQSRAQHGMWDQDGDPIMRYTGEGDHAATLTGLKKWNGASGYVGVDPSTNEVIIQVRNDSTWRFAPSFDGNERACLVDRAGRSFTPAEVAEFAANRFFMHRP